MVHSANLRLTKNANQRNCLLTTTVFPNMRQFQSHMTREDRSTARRTVDCANMRQTDYVFEREREREGEMNLSSMGQKLIGVGRVGTAEDNRGGGHGGGGLSGKVGPWVAGIDLICPPICGHVLWPLPTEVISVSISHLPK